MVLSRLDSGSPVENEFKRSNCTVSSYIRNQFPELQKYLQRKRTSIFDNNPSLSEIVPGELDELEADNRNSVMKPSTHLIEGQEHSSKELIGSSKPSNTSSINVYCVKFWIEKLPCELF